MILASSRRRFLVGLGACAFVPSVAAVSSASPAAATASASASEEEHPPECLADLIESGEVTRADLMVG